ncbi:4242_t:CDS:10 [Entrophospora sp. SA101]|nr:4242_t:CDS:10 [Entrophospora sp. SA101]
MKTICLVDKMRWDFPGNMNPHAFAFGDVDNDKDNEFVIGNLNGKLAVFKGASRTPSLNCDGLGTITCLAVGDVKNCGREKKKWVFDGQITSLSTATDPNTGSILFLVGQPGGHFIIIDENENKSTPIENLNYIQQHKDEFTEISTEIVRGTKIGKDGKKTDVIALITMDGKFGLYDLKSSSMKHIELQVTHKIFGISAINLRRRNQNPDDIFVACAWNGNTYIIDQDFNVVRFEFDRRVCAFAAGKYAIKQGINIPCFMYIDFENQITVYYNLFIDIKPLNNFMDEIMQGTENLDQFHDFLKDNVVNYEIEIASIVDKQVGPFWEHKN